MDPVFIISLSLVKRITVMHFITTIITFTVPVIRNTIIIIIIVVILVITIIIITVIIIIIIIIMIVRDTNSDQRRGESKTSCGGTSSMIFPQFKHLNHSFQVSKSLCESLVELGCNSKLLMFGRPGC